MNTTNPFRFGLAWIVIAGVLAPLAGCGNAERGWPPAPPLEAQSAAQTTVSIGSVTAAPRPAGGWDATFRFVGPRSARSVSVAGSFNRWDREAMPLVREAGDLWTGTLVLGSGMHAYKFVVDGEHWIADPRNEDREPDNHGGFNSVLRLGALAGLRESSAKRGDGAIDAIGVEHDPARGQYWERLDDRRALVRIRTLARDVEEVELVIRNGDRTAMTLADEGRVFDLWEAQVTLPRRGSVEYSFVLTDGATRRSTARTVRTPADERGMFQTPDWAKDAVWYQVMVDRFRNGDRANDPPNAHPWTSDWFATADYEARSGESFYQSFVFRRLYGGDIAGLEQSLPYLRELGVNAIYLNPVFIAETHHKYDATNFLHIDPHYGAGAADDYAEIAAQEDLLDPQTWRWTKSDRVFLAFLRKAKAQGFRVILDGVFNHVGTAHPAFADVVKNGRGSRFADWFDVTSWTPFEYNGWGGFGGLPAFRKTRDGLASEALVRHIFDVTRRWMDPDGDGDPSDGIDGWRLDVPNEIPPQFWERWRAHVKSINPDAYITGEIWDRAETWLDGRHFDAVMNYEFSRPAIDWALFQRRKITASELDRRLRELRLAYPWAATLVMQNLVGSHDTDRVASMALNPDRLYDQENRIQDNGPNYSNAKPDAVCYQRVRLLLLLQMTYVGAPMIWYGDEVGMWGADDPTCRKPMLWKDLEPYANPHENFVMEDHRAFYQRAIALRNAHGALRRGAIRTLLTDDFADVWAFVRSDDAEHVLVALNGSVNPRAARIPVGEGLPGRWRVVFSTPTSTADAAQHAEGADVSADAGGVVTLEIPPYSGVVLRSGRK
ncbi:MAG: alpha amylase N-terminal ig-like domain-containing protein [Phycisphaerales bacterium]|nr:alpha amylase N-terminal ig-like domain-containing protein [Phycisphaerales bacterium]